MRKNLPIIVGLVALLALLGGAVAAAVANPVIITDYHTWFQSQTTLFAAVALLTPWIVKLTTALGKDWFNTSGAATQWLSLVVSIVIAGIGGWLSLGFLAGSSGWHGALQAVILIAIAFLGSNGLAKAARQEAASGVARAKSIKG